MVKKKLSLSLIHCSLFLTLITIITSHNNYQ